MAEKAFLGCAGLEITDEIKVTVAANACVLLLGVPILTFSHAWWKSSFIRTL